MLWNDEYQQEVDLFGKDEIAFYQCDHLGRPQELKDSEGKVACSAQYKAWGQAKETISGAEYKAGIRNPIRFQGQYLDDETGLHYNRYRYYDPDTTRYLTQDPVGLIGGTNLYRYAPNPIAWADQLGLSNNNFGDRASIKNRVLRKITKSQEARNASNFQEHGNRESPPNRGFKEDPVDFTILPGSKIDRYGSPYGTFTSPAGTPYRARAPKPGTDLKPHCVYEVNKPLTVKAG